MFNASVNAGSVSKADLFSLLDSFKYTGPHVPYVILDQNKESTYEEIKGPGAVFTTLHFFFT
jgi:hypothetical protein